MITQQRRLRRFHLRGTRAPDTRLHKTNVERPASRAVDCPGGRATFRDTLCVRREDPEPYKCGPGFPFPSTSQCSPPPSRGIPCTPLHPSIPKPRQGPEDSPRGGNGARGQRFGAQHVERRRAGLGEGACAQCAALRRSSVIPSPRRWALAVTS